MRDPEWVSLSDAERGQLVGIWLLAADRDGVIPASSMLIQKLSFMESEPNINKFIELGFICHNDANMTPERRQHDEPKAEAKAKAEAEAETGTKVEASTEKKTNPSFFKLNEKYQEELNALTEKLLPVFPKIIHFRNEKLNIGVNPKTMIHAFQKALKKQTFDDVRGGIESYIAKIIIIEDGNFNIAEHQGEHEAHKADTDIPYAIKQTIQPIGGVR